VRITLKLTICFLLLLSSASIFAQESAEITNKSDIKALLNELNDEDKIDLIVGSGSSLELFNYKTMKKESLMYPHKLTLEEGYLYVPPYQEIQALYRTLVRDGETPFSALYESNVVAMEILAKDQ
jgi:hypothetical protein